MHPDDTAPDGAVLIPLRARDGSVRAYAIVDAADADFVNQWRWSLRSGGYVHRGTNSRGHYFLHRELLGCVEGDGVVVDHINRNRLDNRRSNIRATTKQGNGQNSSSQRGKSSQYRGVHWSKTSKCWIVQVKVDGRAKHIGRFTDEEEAARAAQAARRMHYSHAVD